MTPVVKGFAAPSIIVEGAQSDNHQFRSISHGEGGGDSPNGSPGPFR